MAKEKDVMAKAATFVHAGTRASSAGELAIRETFSRHNLAPFRTTLNVNEEEESASLLAVLTGRVPVAAISSAPIPEDKETILKREKSKKLRARFRELAWKVCACAQLIKRVSVCAGSG
jgi:hypothetical protein